MVDICNECSVSLVSVIIALAKLEEQQISIQMKTGDSNKIELVEETLALIKISKIPNNAFHEIRRFADIIWGIELGAPLHNINDYIKQKCPFDDCTSSVLSLQVSIVPHQIIKIMWIILALILQMIRVIN